MSYNFRQVILSFASMLIVALMLLLPFWWGDKGPGEMERLFIHWVLVFLVIAYVAFIFPFLWLIHICFQRFGKKVFFIFPFVTGLYGALAATLLVSVIFMGTVRVDIIEDNLLPAGIGFVWGLLYEILAYTSLLDFFRPLKVRVISALAIVTLLLFINFVLPFIAPGVAYYCFEGNIERRAVDPYFKELKVEDSISVMNSRFPRFLPANGNLFYRSLEDTVYCVYVERGVVKSIRNDGKVRRR